MHPDSFSWKTYLPFESIMAYVKSCANPLLYAGMKDEFRKGFVRIVFGSISENEKKCFS